MYTVNFQGYANAGHSEVNADQLVTSYLTDISQAWINIFSPVSHGSL